jgi:hypothetical protein
MSSLTMPIGEQIPLSECGSKPTTYDQILLRAFSFAAKQKTTLLPVRDNLVSDQGPPISARTVQLLTSPRVAVVGDFARDLFSTLTTLSASEANLNARLVLLSSALVRCSDNYIDAKDFDKSQSQAALGTIMNWLGAGSEVQELYTSNSEHWSVIKDLSLDIHVLLNALNPEIGISFLKGMSRMVELDRESDTNRSLSVSYEIGKVTMSELFSAPKSYALPQYHTFLRVMGGCLGLACILSDFIDREKDLEAGQITFATSGDWRLSDLFKIIRNETADILSDLSCLEPEQRKDCYRLLVRSLVMAAFAWQKKFDRSL